MSCPYEKNSNLKQLPCHWVQHPNNPALRVCDVCRASYNLNEFKAVKISFWNIVVLSLLAFLVIHLLTN
jgi:hypothetical protein